MPDGLAIIALAERRAAFARTHGDDGGKARIIGACPQCGLAEARDAIERDAPTVDGWIQRQMFAHKRQPLGPSRDRAGVVRLALRFIKRVIDLTQAQCRAAEEIRLDLGVVNQRHAKAAREVSGGIGLRNRARLSAGNALAVLPAIRLLDARIVDHDDVWAEIRHQHDGRGSR